MIRPTTILGIDPGLRHTGWGVVRQEGNRLSFVASGRVSPAANLQLSERLLKLAEGLASVISRYRPDEAALEETFVNAGARSALALGQARGAVLLALAQAGLCVTDYAANRVKQSVTGYGHAGKGQMAAMVGMLLPGSGRLPADAADALAVAIAHAHHRGAGKLSKLKVRKA